MSGGTHTPGPWMNAGPVGYSTGIISEGGWIAVVYGKESNPNANATASLIVAAPDMLNALKAAEGHLAEMLADKRWHPIGNCPVLDLVRAAIAKAEYRDARRAA